MFTVDGVKRTRVASVLVAISAVGLVLIAGQPAAAQVPAATEQWLTTVNDFRDSLRLKPVRESAAMSSAARKHSIYMVQTGFVEHGEKTDSRWSTPEGREAGEQSNVAGGTGPAPTQAQTVQLWVEGPFHRIGLMRPGWRTTGYALETAHRDGEDRWGATLNVIAGITGSSAAQWPVVWPNARQEVDAAYLTFERIEWPDPVVGCPRANDTTFGTIITASFGPGADVKVKSAQLRVRGGDAVPICVESARSYKRDDYTDVGWRLLQEHNTVMVLPRLALSAGTTYQGRITLTDGRVARILFTTAAN